VLYQAELRPPCGEQVSSAPGRTRTPNLRIRSPLLYPIELQGQGLLCAPEGDPFERVKGIEPSPPAWKAGALPLSYTRELSHCKCLVGLVGLEPTTSCSQSTRATKLRHSPSRHQGNSQPFLVTDDS
jgi:hypothetical protein